MGSFPVQISDFNNTQHHLDPCLPPDLLPLLRQLAWGGQGEVGQGNLLPPTYLLSLLHTLNYSTSFDISYTFQLPPVGVFCDINSSTSSSHNAIASKTSF